MKTTLNFLKPPKVAGEQELIKTALMVYWSKTGNTQKIASAIKQGLARAITYRFRVADFEKALRMADNPAEKALKLVISQ